MTIITGKKDFGNQLNGAKIIETGVISRPWFLQTLSFIFLNIKYVNHRDFQIIHTFGANSFRQDIINAASVQLTWFKTSLRATKFLSKRWWLKLLNPLHYLTIAIEFWQYRLRPGRFIIACSKITAHELMTDYRVPADRVRVVYNGVNCDEFSPIHRLQNRALMRATLGIEDKTLTLLFAAHEFQRKGLGPLLIALKHVMQQNPQRNFKLLVAGRDNPKAHKAFAEELGIAEKISFLGPRRDMPLLLAAADAFVFPTTYEAFGLVILEAMAMGLPVITSKCAGAAELIQDGESGLLLQDPTNHQEISAAIALLYNEELCKKLSAKGRLVAEKHDWSEMARETAAIYVESLKKS